MHRFCVYLLVAASLSGCSGATWKRSETLLDRRRMIVEKETLTEDGRPRSAGYSHPIDLQPEFIADCLARIHYKGAQLFHAKELPYAIAPAIWEPLAAILTRALRSSQPTERVRFRVKNPATALWVVPVETVSQGVAFIEPDGVFNLAFYRVGHVEDDQDSDSRRGWADPTRRTASRGTLVVGPGGDLCVPEGGREQRLWARFPIGELPALPEGTPPRARPRQPATTETPKQPLTDQETLERLRYLEELHDDGTLSDEEYEKKKAELLRRDES